MREIRDKLEHFDRYEKRDGVPFSITYDGDDNERRELTLHLGDMRLDMDVAVNEAQRLARATFVALDAATARLSR